MKKSFLAVAALMVSSVVFAQVDSTSQSSPSTDYSQSGSATDTVSQSGTQTDTLSNTGAQTDTLSNEGSGSSGSLPGQMGTPSDNSGSSDTTGSTGNTGQATMPSDSSATGSSTSAADTTAGFTDEDLKKYAEVLDSVDAMKKDLLAELTTRVKSNPKMTVSRYMELSKANGDEAKLQELKATPEEAAFVKEVTEFKNERASEISEQVKTMARDYVGNEAYNKIKNQLSWDSALEKKIEDIRAENKKSETASTK